MPRPPPPSGTRASRGGAARLLLGIAVALGLAAAAVALLSDGRGPKVSAIWPLDLARSDGWLLDRRIAELRSDPDLCRAVLSRPHIAAAAVPDHDAGRGCGWTNAVRVAEVGGARLGGPTMTCELSAALALWLNHAVQQKAVEHFGQKVVRIQHLGTYACRNIRGNPGFSSDRSEHANANAVDIKGFVLADGREIQIRRHWGGAGAEARFLADIHRLSCRYFRVAIGPEYNEAHRDHFHFDRGPWRECE